MESKITKKESKKLMKAYRKEAGEVITAQVKAITTGLRISRNRYRKAFFISIAINFILSFSIGAICLYILMPKN